LRYVIKFAYIAAIDQYLKVEELPSGKGIADVVYLPKRRSTLPALVVGSGCKYAGYRMGKAYRHIPMPLVKGCSMNALYWEKKETGQPGR